MPSRLTSLSYATKGKSSGQNWHAQRSSRGRFLRHTAGQKCVCVCVCAREREGGGVCERACECVRKKNSKHAFHTAADGATASAFQTDVRADAERAAVEEKKRTKWEPTEIEAPVFADELQRVHQLTPTQCLCRGYLHNVERQSQCKQHRTTGRGHLFDLQHKTEQKRTKSTHEMKHRASK